ncbi:MAG: DUF2970 domain-containing protein [Pseudomonadales bacterium]|nr:DUF2970 domain-containing protein [Pseudomonadales bacterium]MCP5357221.1 DUF2970 domain-containing protein [Pseudomonadales bacterium]
MSQDTEKQKEEPKRKQSFWRNMLSVMQASFGVQSQENKERDFANGSITGFIAAALIFTVLFVLTLVVVVKTVLP